MNVAEGSHGLTPFFFFFFIPILSFLVIIPSIALLTSAAGDLPLNTNSRWIVRPTGERVKLACVNWASHLEPVVAEGLSKQPLDAISKLIVGMGFNCVRFTWPLFLATNDTLANLTVRQSLTGLGLNGAIDGFQTYNPNLLDFTLMEAFKEVVTNLGDNSVMVILDNHISQPTWCCISTDDSGFFGDKYFNPDVWLIGLTRMATLFKGTPNVIGMSLRNELRGPRQNVPRWYRYMKKGAKAVHSANQDVLVILSGLSFDLDLSFLVRRQIELDFTSKLVFEFHWYSFSFGRVWQKGNLNDVCGEERRGVMTRAGFLLEKDNGFPLLLSEFGMDVRGNDVNGNRFMNCLLSVAAELDLDLALWTLVGSYYYRQEVVDMVEFYGILNSNWTMPRSKSFLGRISAIQPPFRGPGLSGEPHKLYFHPLTGLCVRRGSRPKSLKLSNCLESENWMYTEEKTLSIMGTALCVQAVGLGKPAELRTDCHTAASEWNTISDSSMHLSAELLNGIQVCLDVDDKGTIITNACKCLSTKNKCDPASQWFKLVDTTRSST